jgi:hypothetical protein
MLTGWLGFGRWVVKKDHFVEASPAYARTPIRAGQMDQVDEVGPVPGPDEAPPSEITHGAVYSAATAGHLLCWFGLLPPFVVAPGRIPRTEFRVLWDAPVLHALNRSLAHPDYDPLSEDELDITRSLRLGTWNGQEMRSGIRLVVYGGTFHARANFKRAPPAAA